MLSLLKKKWSSNVPIYMFIFLHATVAWLAIWKIWSRWEPAAAERSPPLSF